MTYMVTYVMCQRKLDIPGQEPGLDGAKFRRDRVGARARPSETEAAGEEEIR